VQILPHLSFLFLELSYELISHNDFKHVVCYGVISDGILSYGYISMDGHIIPDAGKVNTAVMNALVRPVSTSLHIFVPFAS